MIRFVLVMLMALAGMAVVPAASAQTGTFRYPDQGAAYSACLAAKQLAIAKGYEGYLTADGKCTIQAAASTDPFYRCRVGLSGGFPCDKDYPEIFKWQESGACSTRTDMLNVRYNGGGSMCSGGCAYAPVIGAGEGNRVVKVKSSTGGSYEVTKADRMAPTGEACTVSKETPEVFNGDDQCFQDPKLTQCVKQDGTICAGKNKQFCWSPGEHGIKTSGNEAASLVPEGKNANLPPVAPKNGGEWEKVADALVTIAENKSGNSTTNNSTLNNYESSYGGGGNGASGNGASGEGNGGSGDGTGSGNGDGEGGDGDGAGAPGQGVGDLYTNSGKTVAGVFGEFKARVGNSPLIAATRAFFTVNASGGCPVFTVPASAYWESMTYDAHCSGDFLAALRSIGWVLMAIAALAAAYWALS